MSRIGKLPIALPAGVSVDISDENLVTVKGPKGTLSQQVNRDIAVKLEGLAIQVSRPTDNKQHRAMHGLYRALIQNMVTGVTTGFSKGLELVGTGYRAQSQNNQLTINIGFSHPVVLSAPTNITFETPSPTKIIVRGIDRQQVGAIAADIRAIRSPEPYLGKGIKYDNEVIRRKEGKAGKAGKK